MKTDLESYYDSYAKTYDLKRSSRQFKKLNQTQLEFLRFCTDGSQKLLEVGCGTGEILQYFPKATGIDFSAGMVARAKEKGLKVKQADATNLPFPDKSFDFAYSFKVLAHVPNYQKMLSEMAIHDPDAFAAVVAQARQALAS